MDNKALLIAEMDRQGVTDNALRAGLAAIIGGESGWHPHTETPYRNTANSRIRSIFPTALGDMPDGFITRLKADDRAFFNYVYGPQGAGPQLGNAENDDGYTYRGRGGIQLTGRGNYKKLGEMVGLDLIGNPELVNDPTHSVAISVAYMRWRYKGGGWEAMKRAVGNSFGNVDDAKNGLFAEYTRTGEFNAGSAALQAQASKPMQGYDRYLVAKALQTALLSVDPTLVVDGKWGTRSRAAYNKFNGAR
jgi:predicted chitinase